ncbi:hypothetical protein BDW22DRAFT_1351563 [Trametopsis cervina]|nr:hypothetical protein BDW22DRAFT_1351563 [Trametopsis cervina]
MSLLQRFALLFSVYTWFTLVCGVPSFDGITFWSSDTGSIVPGMSALEALGPNNNYENGHYMPRFLTLSGERGAPGNATVKTVLGRTPPPLFYIHNSQLWQYHNASTILPVNVHNSTLSSQLPLQMIAGKKRDGVKGGSWRWQGTQLVYEQGKSNNGGVYYSCQDTNGLMGVFLFMRPSPTPQGCTIFTIHSFVRDH